MGSRTRHCIHGPLVAVDTALAACACVVLHEGDWAVGIVRVDLRAGQGMERLPGAVQADGEDVRASGFQRQATIVLSSRLLFQHAHLRRLLPLPASAETGLHAKVEGFVLVLGILGQQLFLVPEMQVGQRDGQSEDGNSSND